ncbi:hypothetical protein BT96DRAFT_1002834 [Gymnopus androsaceus JB14]|uniref:Uncharacterized protein n=1 Tax=Gymnopus androsaceus JB14 TaxID=1447944 RepID=A0A6A4GVI7_9AGAR|nr:hypothetical protein BT96DRAFT_1002834 [Gymnopus androsaceus JB14]
MSDPTKVAIGVPSKDPKAKKPEETDKEEGVSKKSDKDKKDEDNPEVKVTSCLKIFNYILSWNCLLNN